MLNVTANIFSHYIEITTNGGMKHVLNVHHVLGHNLNHQKEIIITIHATRHCLKTHQLVNVQSVIS